MAKPILYLTLFTFIILCNTQADAQGRWKPGYLVKTNGDTLSGFIAYKEKANAPKTIVFKKQKDGTKTIYKFSDLVFVNIKLPSQDIYFKSFETTIDYSQVDLAWINTSPIPDLVKCKIFAQLLVKGTKSLYSYKDTILYKKHYLIESPEGKVTDLINKRYYTDESKTHISYNQEYKKQLLDFYSDCTAIGFNKIYTTQFILTDMMDLAKEYNTCNKPDANLAYEFKPERIKASFGAIVGANTATAKISGIAYNLPHFNTSVHFDAGLFLNLFPPHTEKRLSLYNELLYTGYDIKSANYLSYRQNTFAEVKASYLKLYTALRYQHPYRDLKPFIQLGISNGLALSVSANETYETTGGYNATTPLMPCRKYEQAYFVGLGAYYKKFELEFRYEKGNGFSDYPSVTTKTTYFSTLLKYSIL